MLNFIDNFLNKITMYRLVLYVLIFLVAVAAILGYFGFVPYSPIAILYSVMYITILCWLLNTLAGWAFNAPTNIESVYITALILALIITPIKQPDFLYFAFVFWAAVWAVASKYLLAIGKKHIFNPAAFAVALTALTINQSASWWVATAPLLPFVAVGGLLIVRKIKRFDLFWSFLISASATTLCLAVYNHGNFAISANHLFISSPLIFFAAIMLTEPLTTPPTKGLRIVYGALVGVLFVPQVHIGAIFSTPELALLAGNVFAYLVSPKQKLLLALEQKIELAPSVYNFIFRTRQKMNFKPGQYLEWTLDHESPDSRGNRRYFTIASSPTEQELILGVKFYDPASSFKQTLIGLGNGDKIIASQLAGDFTMPKNVNEKLVFIAGGIGVTPFRSMVKYLIDRREKRPIVIFYSNRTVEDIVYKDVFDVAGEQLGIKTIYTITDAAANPAWQGRRGVITKEVIEQEVPDFFERIFYLSGPRSMVLAFEKTLSDMGVTKSKIRTDYFPGFA